MYSVVHNTIYPLLFREYVLTWQAIIFLLALSKILLLQNTFCCHQILWNYVNLSRKKKKLRAKYRIFPKDSSQWPPGSAQTKYFRQAWYHQMIKVIVLIFECYEDRFGFLRSQGFQKYSRYYHVFPKYFVWANSGGHCV